MNQRTLITLFSLTVLVLIGLAVYFWGENIFTIYAPLIVSVIAVSISLYPLLPKKPEPYGKVISLVMSPSGTFSYEDINLNIVTIRGFLYNLLVSFTVLKKDLVIKDLEIYIKYPNDNYKYAAHLCRANGYEHDMNNVKKILTVPSNRELIYVNTLESGKLNSYYVCFIVERTQTNNPSDALFEELEFKFFDFSNKSYSVIVNATDINASKMLWEEELWRQS